ncbi:MAG: hypothetical protein H0U49_09340 [Parachlamydiaceae bacterium]|nr:hypothetical protein [Parachlamydiaceae bacterium]
MTDWKRFTFISLKNSANAKYPIETVKKNYENRVMKILDDQEITESTKKQCHNIYAKIKLLFSEIKLEELEDMLTKLEAEFNNFKESAHTSSGDYCVAFFDIALSNLKI